MQVIKRDGRKVNFDKEKIKLAILKAFLDVDGEETPYAKEKARDIANYVANLNTTMSVEDIQDIVEEKLMASNRKDVARAYVKYRYLRTMARSQYENFMSAIKEKVDASNVQNQNANVDFINLVAWRNQADFITRYFKKGSAILVCGTLQNRSWVDQQGQKRYATEINADEVTFGSSASGGSSAPAGEMGGYTPGAYSAPTFNNAQGASFEEIPDDGSLPF